ncbi:MAG: hypothetical protein U9O96_03215 [Candidatus Thermoplasmatota archaeon]|nr:hypothetical protein [Candidatus Thermoplasmatota archaeon]
MPVVSVLIAYILVALALTYRYSMTLSAKEEMPPADLEKERIRAKVEKARLKLEKKKLKAEGKTGKKEQIIDTIKNTD